MRREQRGMTNSGDFCKGALNALLLMENSCITLSFNERHEIIKHFKSKKTFLISSATRIFRFLSNLKHGLVLNNTQNSAEIFKSFADKQDNFYLIFSCKSSRSFKSRWTFNDSSCFRVPFHLIYDTFCDFRNDKCNHTKRLIFHKLDVILRRLFIISKKILFFFVF